MKTMISYWRACTVLCGGLLASPVQAQGLGNVSQGNQGTEAPKVGQSYVDTSSGETPNPQVLGMEIPLLDPASNTMTYNGAKIDVGNNELVRMRFEKYLQQNPDVSTEAKRYRKKMNELLKLTQKSARSKKAVGSDVLVKIGNGLYELNDYEGDSGQAASLAGAIASALAVQYANRSRDRENAALEKEVAELVDRTNRYQNRNTGKAAKLLGKDKDREAPKTTTNDYLIEHNKILVKKKQALGVKNDADSVAFLELSKINFQSTIISMLLNRRYNHALIGAQTYRHIFRDGDTTLKIDSESQAGKLFEGGVGQPPTVNTMSSIAASMRRDVDQNMEAVVNMLAQNRLGEATQSLIQAVATGEYMESVATFPIEGRRRIAEYWSLRKRALPALNARDYGAVEEIAAKLKQLDVDFDDSMLTSYCAGRKAQSDLHLRNAAKALKAGDDERFNEEITKAGTIWPKNPNLQKGREQLEKVDNQDAVRDEFRTLMARKAYRTVYDEQDKFEVVAIDQELKQQYKEAITLIGTIDGMLTQLEIIAKQDSVMGPCMAYETLLERGEQDARFKEDEKYRDALNRYALAAHDFTQALEKARECEQRREYGSALANYYRAQCLYPRSTAAGAGARRVTEIILKAQF